MVKNYEFTEEDREELIRLLNGRSYFGVKNYLSQLKIIQPKKDYSEFFSKIKAILRNCGKSNIIYREDIENLIEEFE